MGRPFGEARSRTALLTIAGALATMAMPAFAQQQSSEPAMISSSMSGSYWMYLPPEIKQALRDPQQRKQLLAAERARIQAKEPDLARVVRLQAPLATALLTLLAEQRLAEMDRSVAPNERDNSIQANAVVQVRRNQDILTLLGEENFERYLDYKESYLERGQVKQFLDALAPAERLSFEQRERLVAVLVDERNKTKARDWIQLDPFNPPGAGKALDDVVEFENLLRRLETAQAALLQRLPTVLTGRQLAAFAKPEDEAQASLRQELAVMRRQAGQTPEVTLGIPAVPQAGPMQLQLSVQINGTPSAPLPLSLRLEHGATVTFDAPAGMLGEAIAFFFNGELMIARFRFYDRTATGRHLAAELPVSPYGLERPAIMRLGRSSATFGYGRRGEPYAISVQYSAVRL